MGSKSQKLADSWQEALGSKTQPALLVLPLDHGFTTPDVAVLTEQDMLGDRLVRRRKKGRRQRHSSKNWQRCRQAISWSTPITALAATKG